MNCEIKEPDKLQTVFPLNYPYLSFLDGPDMLDFLCREVLPGPLGPKPVAALMLATCSLLGKEAAVGQGVAQNYILQSI